MSVLDTAATVIVDTYERYAPVDAVLRSEAWSIALALRDAGLLAGDDSRCGWAVYDDEKLEQWPSEASARAQMADFYTEQARLLRWSDREGWVDVDA